MHWCSCLKVNVAFSFYFKKHHYCLLCCQPSRLGLLKSFIEGGLDNLQIGIVVVTSNILSTAVLMVVFIFPQFSNPSKVVTLFIFRLSEVIITIFTPLLQRHLLYPRCKPLGFDSLAHRCSPEQAPRGRLPANVNHRKSLRILKKYKSQYLRNYILKGLSQPGQ